MTKYFKSMSPALLAFIAHRDINASGVTSTLEEAQLSEKYKKMYEDSLTRIKELTVLNKGLESENRLLTERNIRMASVLDKLRSTLDSFTENKK